MKRIRYSFHIVPALILATLAVSAVALAPTSSFAQTYKQSFHASLQGGSEVPPVDTNATGSAMFHVAEGEGFIDFELHASTTEPVTAAHLHCAPAGTNGPVVATLYTQNGTTSDTMLSVTGQLSAADVSANCGGISTLPHLIQAMREGRLYVNAHSATYPAGIIRGQVMAGTMSPPPNDGDDDNGTTTPPMEIEEEITHILEQIRLLRERLVELLGMLWNS